MPLRVNFHLKAKQKKNVALPPLNVYPSTLKYLLEAPLWVADYSPNRI